MAGSSPRHAFRRLVPGERLGGSDGRRFEILQSLGAGAMGQVFRARDEELQRVVALKFLFPREELAGMALREARAIAQLDHENIVRIFDISEWAKGPGRHPVPVLVMECLEGESLAAVLRRENRLAPWRALDILRGVAAGLAHAHQHHIVHRDLKPSNVFITRQGTVKLLDFGLAWLTEGPSALPHLPTAGTPAYMAPEQWRGRRVDERTDLWAAGIMLYELLTGELPYPSMNLEELREKVLSPETVPPLHARHPELRGELESLLSVVLAKEPSQRLLSAEELSEELHELEEQFRPGREPLRSVAPQRRQVTLVSCRLEGLSALAEEMDPEDFGELEATFHQCASKVMQRHGGFVHLCMGNETLACFGYPVAREGDSERAVLAGLALPTAVREALQGKVPPGSHTVLSARVGIYTDMVVLDDILPELRGRTLTIQGEAPRVAGWLARQAGPDEVVVGPTTHNLVQHAFDTEPLGPRMLDDRRELAVHRVLRSREAIIRFERARTGGGTLSPLVGRDRELGRLLDAWRRARERQGSYVLLSGEAGIGKSRLIQELIERVSPERPTLLRLQCWSQYSASALHPVIEMLQRMWLRPERSRQETLRVVEAHFQQRGLSPIQVGLLAELMSLPVAEDSPHLHLTPQKKKEEMLAALASLLMWNAREQPVLIVVEDLHWADPSTLQLLNYLLEEVERTRVLFVLSARPEFRPPRAHGPDFESIPLERLPAACTERLVREVTRGQSLPEEVTRQLVARTDGIPLFVEEMTRMILEGGTPASIPLTLQELLLAQLDSLPRRQKQLAQLCALIGRTFSQALLVILTGRSEPALRRELMGLVSAGLIQAQPDDPEPTYQFRHSLIQEAACQSQPRGTRRHYHRKIAHVLETHFPGVAETRPELLARHYEEAQEFRSAIHYWRKGGMLATLRHASTEAVSHLTQALKLLRSLPDSTELTKEELQLLTALGMPLMQVQGVQSSEVESTYARAQALFRQVGEELPRLELSFWGSFVYYCMRARFHDAHKVAELLVELGERQDNSEMLCMGHRMMATNFFTWGDIRQSLRHVEQARAHSDFDLERHRELAVRQWVDPSVSVLTIGSLPLSVVGEEDQAERFTREALELAGRIGHPNTMAFALTHCAFGSQVRGDANTTLAYTEQCISLMHEHRLSPWCMQSSSLRAWALSELGRPEEGLVLMLRTHKQWEHSGILAAMHHNLGMLASIYLRLGRVKEGLAAVDEALTWPPRTKEYWYLPELLRTRGELLRMAGREAEAREVFLEAIHFAHEHEMTIYERRARASLNQLSEPHEASFHKQ
ncbi:protein kinase domain-containing protein [Cystobacter fuscus]|uniref:protein kinase domain-containing protein n=1 Tax=Cystobacter fuscus TaxID=43 RepID=UPI0018DFD45D|nr:protein kinase [Cystobacter fuscus]